MNRGARKQRIVVLGCSGSGKSTLAAELSRRLALPYVPTDHKYWTAGWRPVSGNDLRGWLTEETAKPCWVFDGNFDTERDILWARADLAVWLDLPLAVTLWRVARRNIAWWLTRKPVWGMRRMTLGKVWGGIRHAARTHALKRRTYPAMLAALPHLTAIRIHSNTALNIWLANMNR